MGRDADELISPAVDAQSVGAPKAAEEKFVKVVGDVGNKPVERDGSPKMKHRGDLDTSVRSARHPADGSPGEDRMQARRTDGGRHQRPVAEALESHSDADAVSDQLRADLYGGDSDVSELPL